MNTKDVCDLEKYLPLGTICRLKGSKHKMMITGFCMYEHDEKHTLYDYCGCAYPEGMLSTNEVSLFNQEDLEKVYIIGPSNEEDKKFKVNLGSVLQIIESAPNEMEEPVVQEEPPEEDIYVVGE